MKLAKLGVLVASAVLVFGACSGSAASPPSDPLGVVTIAAGDAWEHCMKLGIRWAGC